MSRIRLAALLLPAFFSAACRAVPDTLLTTAAAKGDAARIAALVAGGAAVDGLDGNGLTPLMWAARGGHVEAIRALIQAGADVNRYDRRHGWTVLMHAIHTNQTEAVHALLAADASPNGRTSAMTPLIMAAGYGYTDIVRDLLKHGADPYATGAGGVNALSAAVGGATDVDRFTVASCQTPTVKALLERAPDLMLDTSKADGRWALRFAQIGACDEVVNLVSATGRRQTR